MSYNDYTDLRIAVAEQVGNRDISDLLDRFTLLAESWINRELRCRNQIKTANVTFVNGLASLPVDFIEVAGLYTVYGVPIASSTRDVVKATKGGYAVTATDIYLPDSNETLELEYYAKIPSLTDPLNTTNWLLSLVPNLYLYLISLEAAKWLKDVDLASAMAGLVEDEHDSLKWADIRSRYGSSSVAIAGYGP